MTDHLLPIGDGHTPLSDEDRQGLRPTYISTRRVWVEHDTFERDELAVRFHHRLVVIHPFRNGNGRHSRICADYLVRGLGGSRFSWAANHDATTEVIRAEYLRSLREADRNGDFSPLIAFARS